MATPTTKSRTCCVVCGHVENVTYHRFPPDESIRKIWIFRIPKKDFVWKDYKRLCSNHFKSSDYKEESTDSNKWRKNKGEKLKRKELKHGALPSIWLGTLPSFINESPAPRSTNLSLPSVRSDIEIKASEIKDGISTIDDLRNCDIKVPSSVLKICDKTSVMFLKLQTIDAPRIEYSVKINEMLEYEIIWESIQLFSKDLLDDKTLAQTTMSSFSYLVKYEVFQYRWPYCIYCCCWGD